MAKDKQVLDKKGKQQAIIDSVGWKIFVKYNEELLTAPAKHVKGMQGMAKPKLLWTVRSEFVDRAKMLNEQAISLGLVPYFSPEDIDKAEKLAVEPGLLD